VQTVRDAQGAEKLIRGCPREPFLVATLEVDTEKKKHELILLQAEHSGYLFKRENEILDKIEQELSLTPEEQMLFFMRTFQHMQQTLDQIEENTERG